MLYTPVQTRARPAIPAKFDFFYNVNKAIKQKKCQHFQLNLLEDDTEQQGQGQNENKTRIASYEKLVVYRRALRPRSNESAS